MFVEKSKNGFTVRAYRGDAMTLLAFNLDEEKNTENFVGFTIQFIVPGGTKKFAQTNRLNFEGTDKIVSSTKAPFQKFRWMHVPGSRFQPLNETKYGIYTYFVTPRYFNSATDKLFPLDESLTISLDIKVDSFDEENVQIAFTRGFSSSQAYLDRFGEDSTITPQTNSLIPNLNRVSGTNPSGHDYTFNDQYEWMGFKAREKTLDLLKEALDNEDITVEVFAYDLSEPEVMNRLLKLAEKGRIKMILDNSTGSKNGVKIGHGAETSKETRFFNRFLEVKTGNADIVRGRFSRLQHHKVIIIKKNDVPLKVLTGATNFSITGFCVNANHIIIFDSKKVALKYHEVFEASWGVDKMKEFKKSILSKKSFRFTAPHIPLSIINFAPHDEPRAIEILDAIIKRIEKTQKRTNKTRSCVLFSVMSLAKNISGNVVPALREIHKDTNIFSYGITDSVKGVSLYKPNRTTGFLINAKSLKRVLPPPFDKEVKLKAHNIHHKFIVLDFNRPDAVVYCGSSNLALGGEQNNGDNLIEIRNPEIVTVFAIEALRLVDHYHFRANQIQADENNEPLKLRKTNSWAKPYYNKNDIKFKDRILFCG